MAKLDMFSRDGTPIDQIEVPDQVIGAARIVGDWLRNQPDRYGVAIYGLHLKPPEQRLKAPLQRRVEPELSDYVRSE